MTFMDFRGVSLSCVDLEAVSEPFRVRKMVIVFHKSRCEAGGAHAR